VIACPDDELVLAFFERRLDPEVGAALERHLARCAPCRRLFSRIAQAGAEDVAEDVAATAEDASLAIERPTTSSPRGQALRQVETRRPSGPRGASASHDAPVLLPAGSRVAHFEVVRVLGRGGMGEVYLARDLRLGRRVALKLIRAETLGSRRTVERFLFEARTTARFSHPNIVTVYEVGEDSGRPYLALEYVRGQSLRRRLEQEPPSLQETLRLALAVAEALAEAHAAGVLHRDLKPENVMIAADGRPRVLDFGLAKGQGREPGAARVDSVVGEAPREPFETGGQVCGSPLYMSPEQWRGRELTGAADVWSLGVILYEALAGGLPYAEKRLRPLMDQVCDEAPVPSLQTRWQRSPEVVRLVDACLQKSPSARPSAGQLAARLRELLAREPHQPSEALSPFRGLLPFDEEHGPRFFGRDDETAFLVERLREEPAIVVIGASGAGKTSFVQAGVVPRLRERGPLLVVQLRPGAAPFQRLAARLLAARAQPLSPSGSSPFGTREAAAPSSEDSGEREAPEPLATRLLESPPLLGLLLRELAEQRRASLLLHVDQLEELFTLVDDAGVRQRFLEALAGAADDPPAPVRAVMTLREEFVGRLAEAERELLAHVMVLRRPGPPTLGELLLKPVRAAGYSYDDPRIVTEMVAEVQHEAACLPLLQFAGQLLWEHRDREARLLTRAAFAALGGVAGALARHADAVITGLSTSAVRTARTLLLRLVTPEGTRRVLRRSQLLEGTADDAAEVLSSLVGARLITARQADAGGEAEVELAHESLIAAWGQLARWIEESREELAALAELGQAAVLWERRGRRVEEVWGGDALRDACRVVDRVGQVPAAVRSFLETGQQRERRQQRGRRLRLGALVALLALVAVAGVSAALVLSGQKRAVERGWAEAQREGARAAERSADLLEARARLRGALEAEDSALARLLWRRLAAEPQVWSRSLGAIVHRVAFAPDGGLIAASASDHLIYLLDPQTREVRRLLRGHEDQVLSVAFSPDGRALASGGWDGAVRLWELASGRARRLPGGPAATVWDLRFSPDGAQLAAAGGDGKLWVWELAAPERTPRSLAGHLGGVHSVAFSPDSALLASAGEDGSLRLWEARSGWARRTVVAHPGGAHAIAFSPDGRLLASGGEEGRLRLWDPASGRPLRELAGHRASIWGLAFSPDGRLLASGGKDRALQVWDVQSGAARATLSGQEEMIWGLAFSPDSRFLASGSTDRSVRLWDLRVRAPARAERGHLGMVVGAAVSRDGKLLASGGKDGSVRLWDAATGEERAVLRGHTAKVFAVAFSPGGELLASGGNDRRVRLWELGGGRALRSLEQEARVFDLAFSPDGKHLAVASEDRLVRLLDPRSGREERALQGHAAPVHGVAFSPDGAVLASGGADRQVRLWELPSGRVLRVLEGHSAEVWGVAFSPDGRQLVSGSSDRSLRVWDVATGGSSRALRLPGRAYWPAFHPAGDRVGAPGSDGFARICRLTAGATCQLLVGHRSEVNQLRFAPDGGLAVTSSDDGTLRTWDVARARPRWRAPALLARGEVVELASHRGWQRLAGGGTPPDAAWRRAVLERARLAAAAADRLCLVAEGDVLEVWSLLEDRRLLRRTVPGLARVAALSSACATLAGGAITLHAGEAEPRRLVSGGATALAASGEQLLVAAGERVLTFSPRGAPLASLHVDAGVTAMARGEGVLVLGYADGNLELLTLPSGARRAGFALEESPGSAVERLVLGPRGTLVAGYAGGAVGLWHLESGRRLEQGQLHGPVVHLLLAGGRAYAATELGDSLAWDLAALEMDYCALLREVWRRVPVVWAGGAAVRRPPPARHRCAER